MAIETTKVLFFSSPPSRLTNLVTEVSPNQSIVAETVVVEAA